MATFGTFTAGQVLTAAELNGAGAWQDYTPSWTQSATISKTVNWARYTQLNKWVQGSIKMTATSAGTANNKILVSLPVTASSNNFAMGTVVYFDNGAATRAYRYGPAGACLYESSTTIAFSYGEPDATSAFASTSTDLRYGQGAGGMTVASGDIIYIQFSYEAA